MFGAAALTGLARRYRRLPALPPGPGRRDADRVGDTPADNTPEAAARLLRMVNVLGNVNIVLVGTIGAITMILSMKAAKSARWSAVTRFLP